MKETHIHLPGLNGLRAIAALSVVFAHISQKGIADFGFSYLLDLPLAGNGVTLFFVISGFLITFLLLMEVRKTQSISVKGFYIRRILRIWPIYYLFMIVCIVIFIMLGKSHEALVKEIWFYIFFAANIPFIFQNGILILVHYWSIGVEEQFYLIWPWLVKKSKTNLLKISLVIFILLFVTKIGFWFLLGTKSFEYRFLTVTRFHCMMVGAMGAILFVKGHKLFIRISTNKIIQLVSWSFFLLFGLNILHVPAVIGQELIAFVSLNMIMGQIAVTSRIINLENRLCDFVGKISYGIYIIHPMIILLLSKVYKNLIINVNFKYIIVYGSVMAITLFVAWLSYTFYEKLFLKHKRKFAIIQSSNSMFSDSITN